MTLCTPALLLLKCFLLPLHTCYHLDTSAVNDSRSFWGFFSFHKTQVAYVEFGLYSICWLLHLLCLCSQWWGWVTWQYWEVNRQVFSVSLLTCLESHKPQIVCVIILILSINASIRPCCKFHVNKVLWLNTWDWTLIKQHTTVVQWWHRKQRMTSQLLWCYVLVSARESLSGLPASAFNMATWLRNFLMS